MSNSRSLEPRLVRLFREKLNIEVSSVDTDLIETGLVDSLSFVEFLAQIEESFGVQVALEDLELDRFRSISSIAAFLASKIPQASGDTEAAVRSPAA